MQISAGRPILIPILVDHLLCLCVANQCDEAALFCRRVAALWMQLHKYLFLIPPPAPLRRPPSQLDKATPGPQNIAEGSPEIVDF